MAYSDTKLVVGELNYELISRYQAGDPVRLDVDGQPDWSIFSYEPVEYKKYGMVFNRAPQLFGSLALRRILVSPMARERAQLIVGLEAGTENYGFVMDGHNPDVPHMLGTVAAQLDRPEIAFKLDKG